MATTPNYVFIYIKQLFHVIHTQRLIQNGGQNKHGLQDATRPVPRLPNISSHISNSYTYFFPHSQIDIFLIHIPFSSNGSNNCQTFFYTHRSIQDGWRNKHGRQDATRPAPRLPRPWSLGSRPQDSWTRWSHAEPGWWRRSSLVPRAARTSLSRHSTHLSVRTKYKTSSTERQKGLTSSNMNMHLDHIYFCSFPSLYNTSCSLSPMISCLSSLYIRLILSVYVLQMHMFVCSPHCAVLWLCSSLLCLSLFPHHPSSLSLCTFLLQPQISPSLSPYHSLASVALDCWSTGRAIDLAPGAWFISKFIKLAQVVPGPV